MIYKRTLQASDCAIDVKLSLENLFCIIQDAVTDMLTDMGCDNLNLTKNYNIMQVFAKHKAKVFKRPYWSEEVVINTRIAKASRLTCYIKTEVSSLSGEVYIESIIESCLLDTKTFKLMPISSVPYKFTEEEVDTSFSFSNEEMPKIKDFVVMPYLCDMLMHMNNAKALFPLVATFSLDDINEICSHKFELGIKYSAQATLGSNLSLCLSKDQAGLKFKYLAEENKVCELGYIKYLD